VRVALLDTWEVHGVGVGGISGGSGAIVLSTLGVPSGVFADWGRNQLRLVAAVSTVLMSLVLESV
jgi:hypothetical protein